MLDRITFGITSFERPRLLERLVASIRRRYPEAGILVADNGRLKANLPSDVQVLNLEFDCGLSRARNALIDNLKTEFLLLLEEDFLFTDETRIEPFVEILDTDHEVGMIGGAMRGGNGRLGLYCLDIDIFRGVMYVQDATRRMRVTQFGTSYRICDIAWNFGLFRKEFLAMNRWDDRLKVGEHAAYFHQAKLRGHWRVAATPSVVIYHVPDHRTEHYSRHRLRAKNYVKDYLEENGLTDYRRVPPALFHDDAYGKPNIVVLGVGHSGTSVLTRMLKAAGWDTSGSDQEFAECVWMRDVNVELIQTGLFNAERALKRLSAMPQPWAVKDPRFVFTLNYWMPLFAELENPPALVRIVRDTNEVKRSYLRRGFRGNVHEMIDQRLRLCERQYEKWPFARLTIQYEQLATAASLFSQKGSLADDLPPVWPPGPLGSTAAEAGSSTYRAGRNGHDGSFSLVKTAPQRASESHGKQQLKPPGKVAGWQASVQQDELIEGLDEADRQQAATTADPVFVPAWRASVQQNEMTEYSELPTGLPSRPDAAPADFTPGWKAVVPDNQIDKPKGRKKEKSKRQQGDSIPGTDVSQ
ncbi:glycosyltransferase [bacterium]|nr:glycosyltransferase [bacterium]